MNNISDAALDRWYGRNYYGPGIDYFDDVPEDYDPDEEYSDPDWDNWVKPSEREIDY